MCLCVCLRLPTWPCNVFFLRSFPCLPDSVRTLQTCVRRVCSIRFSFSHSTIFFPSSFLLFLTLACSLSLSHTPLLCRFLMWLCPAHVLRSPLISTYFTSKPCYSFAVSAFFLCRLDLPIPACVCVCVCLCLCVRSAAFPICFLTKTMAHLFMPNVSFLSFLSLPITFNCSLALAIAFCQLKLFRLK